MARGGYKFFDTDAHVGPYVDVLETYLSADDKRRLEAWSQYKASSKSGHVSYNKGQRRYQRRLYTEKAEAAPSRLRIQPGSQLAPSSITPIFSFGKRARAACARRRLKPG